MLCGEATWRPLPPGMDPSGSLHRVMTDPDARLTGPTRDDGAVLGADPPLLGSYFVSAYPPFDCWTEAAVPDFRAVLRQASRSGADLGLYVHIPFCIERCQYCYYLSYENRGGEVSRYLEAVVRELELWAEQPLLREREISFVYFGGGTPSLLSEERIRTLLTGLQRVYPWRSAREVTYECAPGSVTLAKLQTLRELGVTRINLGVQQMNDEVLRLNGRVHLVEDVERAWRLIRQVGFPVGNIDLIVGLVGETDRSFSDSLERVVEMAPESVTIYQLEIPHNTPLFRAVTGGEVRGSIAGHDVKRRRLIEGFARLEEAGYTVRSAYSAVRDPREHAFVYQDDQYRGADLLGVGASSFSYLSGVHHQNRASLGSYLAALAKDRLPLWRAYELDEEERFVREVVLQLKLGRLDGGYFRRKFGLDPWVRYEGEMARLREFGWLTVDGDVTRCTPEGLSRVDGLIRELFLPRHRGVAEPVA